MKPISLYRPVPHERLPVFPPIKSSLAPVTVLRLLSSVLCLLFCVLCPPLRAAAPVDLGQGLSYFRVHSLAADSKQLDESLAANHTLVLDLRYPTAAKEDTQAFVAALARHTGPEPLLILVSPATPPAVSEAIWAAPGKCVMLGVKGSVPTPQVIVDQAAETDRQAYDALESGKPLDGLISGKIEKERYDEAALMKDFRSGNTGAEPPALPDPTDKPDEAKKTPPPLVDRVLQRAVNLHRALLAIKPRHQA